MTDPGAPRQPWLHELEIAVDGNATVLADRAGAFGAPGTGLLVDDRRVVSVLSLTLDGEAPTAVQAASVGDTSQFWGCSRNLGALGPDPTVEVHRRHRLLGGGLTQTLTVVSRAEGAIEATIVIELGGDGAELAQLKTAVGLPGLLASTVTLDGVTWADERHRTDCTFTPAPTVITAGDGGRPTRAEFAVTLRQSVPVEISLRVQPTRLVASRFDADAGSGLIDWDQVRVEAGDRRLSDLCAVSLTDLKHLLLTDPEHPADVFAAAGTPWYLTLFGRDAIWAARFMLPFGRTLAAGTLRTLARRQGRATDPDTAEQPGKILHEVRRAHYVDTAGGLDLPPVYYGTVDATALWVVLLHDAWRWGLPDEDVRALLPNLQAAMGWIMAAADNDLGLLRYVDEGGHGLTNQGWKDSGDSMRRRDGSVAPAPIALVEAQSYAVEAARGAAGLYAAYGLAGAERLREWAQQMTDTIREKFWVEGDGVRYLAMAIDGDGRPVDGLGSNMGHVLGSGALSGAEAAAVAAALMSPDLLGEFGISTLSRSNPAYNPIGYHTGSVWTHDTAIALLGMVKEGLSQDAATIAQGLVAATVPFGYRAPELFGGEAVGHRPAPYPASCRPQAWAAASAAAILTGVLGLTADVPNGRLRLTPMRPSPFGAIAVTGLRWAGQPFEIALDRHGVATVTGLPDGVVVVTE